jgi:hypothetical protein
MNMKTRSTPKAQLGCFYTGRENVEDVLQLGKFHKDISIRYVFTTDFVN